MEQTQIHRVLVYPRSSAFFRSIVYFRVLTSFPALVMSCMLIVDFAAVIDHNHLKVAPWKLMPQVLQVDQAW